MSLYGALFAGVSALNAQSQSMGMISDNIANVNTIGYKRTEASFSSLVTASTRSTAYSPGAVRAASLTRVDQQGILQQSRSGTDIAISGNGFFVVKDSIADGLQEAFYTRAGQFSEDSQGNLVNPSGKFLMGWPVDQNGLIPSSSGDLSSLEPIDVAFLGGLSRATTTADIGLNLDARKEPYVYPLTAPTTNTQHATSALRVYDSLGQAQDVKIKFFHTTSPTATAAGSTSIKSLTSPVLFDSFPSISATATYTSTVNIAGTLGALAPTMTTGESFVLKMNGETQTIALDSTWTLANLVTAINSAFTGSPATASGGNLELSASTPIEIKAGGSPQISEANLNALGISYLVQPRDPKTFTLQDGASPAQTVTVSEGNTSADLVAQINALSGINAQFDKDGNVVITADSSGVNLVLGGVGGAIPQISAAGLSSLGFSAGTFIPPASPTLLTPLGVTANPQNWWHVEITGSNGLLLTSGMLNFDGQGQINSNADPAELALSNIVWGNGSDPQDISLEVSNFTQFASENNTVYTNQNGAELGLRTGVSIDRDGFVVARFSNGQSTKLYKLPIATFSNANGLSAKNGNIYQQSNDSGVYNLREAGKGSAGTVESGTLESSNVDLADEFSKMIVTQRAYSAGTKIINTSDQMLEELLRLR
jgi:flagellar hook protein FlgE